MLYMQFHMLTIIRWHSLTQPTTLNILSHTQIYNFIKPIAQNQPLTMDKAVQRQPIQAGSVKKGTFLMLKGRPCKVSEVRTSKTGKHGHAKASITGSCVLTDKKCEEVHPASAGLVEFKLQKLDFLVTSVEKHEQQWKIAALDEEHNEVLFYSKPDSELCKRADVADLIVTNPDKTYTMVVIRAPVENGVNSFVDTELIESFREDKA